MKEIFSFNDGWKIRKECDIPFIFENDYFDSYRSNTKTGLTSGPASMGYYDGDWETVSVPHDWVIEELPDKANLSSQGYRPQGAIWYRKHFSLDEKYRDKKVFLKFDGIAISSQIYINDIKISDSESGYSPINIDVTDFLFFGRNNTVAVRADCRCKEGWWYEGGGIYRNAYLIIKESAHFNDNGVYVTTKNIGSDTWCVTVEAETINADNHQIAIEFIGREYKEPSFKVKNPLLWSADFPNLYELKVKLIKDEVLYDEEIIKVGFREIEFNKDNGFFINGKNDKLKGVCLHHDHAGVGVAVDKNILRYRLRKLKEMGCNAIRTSHNPQSPEFYELCDELGFYVMNEVRHFSSTENGLRELTEFVKRDRNHPCVILWSLFNEEPLQCSEIGEKIIRTMINTLHKYDCTRPVTGGMNGPLEINGVVKYVDVMGFNYLQYGYDEFHRLFPDIPLIGSETGSYLSTRDESVSDRSVSHVSCYGRELWSNLYPWSDTPGGTWQYISNRSYVAGGFYWTGIDYYGETGPYGWPGITSNFGAMDICGFPKDNYYWHKALWNNEYVLETAVHHCVKNGEFLDIICYSNCDVIEMLVNGKRLGEKKNNVFSPEVYTLPYVNDVLTVLGKINGKTVINKEIRPYGNNRNLKISSSEDSITTADTVLLDVVLTDEYGQRVKNEDKNVSITLENGILIGSANGDNSNNRKNNSNVQTFFHGSAQFIVKPLCKGQLKATFTCEDMSIDHTVIVEDTDIKSVSAERFILYSNNHRMSDVHSAYPSIDEIQNNLFTWIPTDIGGAKNLMMSGKYGYAVISGNISITKDMPKKKELVIEKISGDVDVYYGKEKIYSINKAINSDVCISLDEYEALSNRVSLVFKLNGEEYGIAGNIYIRFN